MVPLRPTPPVAPVPPSLPAAPSPAPTVTARTSTSLHPTITIAVELAPGAVAALLVMVKPSK